MKNTPHFLIVAAALALFASAGQASAGGNSCCSGSCGDSLRIAASPKLRATLDERCRSRCVVPTQTAVITGMPQTEIAASPKVQQMRSDHSRAPVVAVTTETAGYRPTGADGITASPKVRAMLDERPQAVEIAPLK